MPPDAKRARMGRPRKDEDERMIHKTFMAPADLIAKLEARAEDEAVTFGALVRRLLSDGLKSGRKNYRPEKP